MVIQDIAIMILDIWVVPGGSSNKIEAKLRGDLCMTHLPGTDNS